MSNRKSFLRWIGNKQKSCNFIKSHLPTNFNNYFEPFIGSGILYFNIMKFSNSTISDINSELINTYQILKNDLNKLIDTLLFYDVNIENFNYLRDLDKHENYENLCPILRATRFIYINYYSFESYYKVNSKNKCNNNFYAKNKEHNIDFDLLETCSKNLQNTNIYNFDYTHILDLVQPNDLVYFDPPYDAISSFQYNNHLPFLSNQQIELKEFCDKLNEKGVFFMLSNNNTKFIQLIYSNYNQYLVPTNGKYEVLITNFKS